jgi:hypothetical protein
VGIGFVGRFAFFGSVKVLSLFWDLRGFQGVFCYKEYSALLGDLPLGVFSDRVWGSLAYLLGSWGFSSLRIGNNILTKYQITESLCDC